MVCNRDHAGSAGFCPHGGDNAIHVERCARGHRLTASHFESPHGIASALAASRRQNLPARSATAAHTGDIAAPCKFFQYLIGRAVEQMYSSVDGSQQPGTSCSRATAVAE